MLTIQLLYDCLLETCSFGIVGRFHVSHRSAAFFRQEELLDQKQGRSEVRWKPLETLGKSNRNPSWNSKKNTILDS